jgi:hypothetical protein
MRTCIVILLAVCCLVNIARADRILVYKGTITQRSVGASVAASDVATTGSSAYYFFDVDTPGYNFITYSDIKGVKHYHINYYEPLPCVISQFTASSRATETTFIISSSTTSTPYLVSTNIFTGVNVLQDFGGTFTGKFPATLRFTEFSVSGDGTLANDVQLSGSGLFRIDLIDTRNANASNYSVASEVATIATGLANTGYSAVP